MTLEQPQNGVNCVGGQYFSLGFSWRSKDRLSYYGLACVVRLKLTNRVIHSCCNTTAKSVEFINDKNIKAHTNMFIKPMIIHGQCPI